MTDASTDPRKRAALSSPRSWLALLILVAALSVLAGAVRNELAPPRIESVPVPGDGPMSLRFAVVNRGFLAGFNDMNFTCVADLVSGRDADGNKVTARGTPFPLNVDIDLAPRASFQYTCPIMGAHLPARVTHIEAHVEASYAHSGHPSHAHSPEFLWDSQSRVWVSASS